MRELAHQDGQRAVNWRARAQRLRALPLSLVLEELAAVRDARDPAKWRTAQGTLSVNGAKFMNWNQSIGGGGAIDLVMHVRQVGFGPALDWLEARFGGMTPSQAQAASGAPKLMLPTPVTQHWPQVERYLLEERKLPKPLLRALVQSGLLYADIRANAVFLLVDSAATAVGADLRGTTALPWRGMAPGSRKDDGFFSIPPTGDQPIVLCESAIDAISCHALHPRHRCLSTSGARPAPAWLSTLLAQGQAISCGFDADPTGDAMAQRMRAVHPAIDRLRPTAKDWNDLLRQSVG